MYFLSMILALTAPIQRADVSNHDKWRVEDLYATKALWEEEYSRISNEGWETLTQYKGNLSHSLGQALQAKFAKELQIERLITYGHLRYDENLSNGENKSANERAMGLYYSYSEAMSWFEPEILQLPDQVIQKVLQDQSLKDYHFYISSLMKMKPHTLSPGEERLLALSGEAMETAGKAFSILNNADLQFPDAKDKEGNWHKVSHARYGTILQGHDRVLRQNAYESVQGTYRQYGNTFAQLLSGHVNTHIFKARARGYPSSLDAALYPKNIDTKVYRQLIQTVRENLEPLHRYVAMRKEILGVEKIRLCDFYVPLVENVDLKIPYDEAVELVVNSLSPLGKKYQNQVRAGLTTEGWVDRYENIGKRSGAYSSGCYGSKPYILMNYDGKIKDMMTLTHEAGHSMHSFTSHQNQPYPKSQYTIFVAEVASTFQEELLFHHLRKTMGKKAQRFLINYRLDAIRGTLYRQALFAEFELKIHEMAEQGIPLTETVLSELYGELNRTYYGPFLEIDENLKSEWMRIPHFYYNFYVYQYSTGISAAHALVKRVQDGHLDDYMQFLSSGGSDYPLNQLQKAGVDMRAPDAIRSLITDFDRLLNEFNQ